MRRSKRVAATSDGAAEAKRGARTADKDGDQAGVDSPKALFALDTPQQYQKYLDLYSQTVAQLPKKSLDTLIASDAWMWGEGRMEIQQRTPPSITSSELQRICMWKFTRGKFRPLMGKIKANPDDLVRYIVKEHTKERERARERMCACSVMTVEGGNVYVRFVCSVGLLFSL
eukprot:m.110933 g.110933  ORF g.110933 m.110933 type:complete len:172 (-) comp13416_c1_seq1:120-635(-)